MFLTQLLTGLFLLLLFLMSIISLIIFFMQYFFIKNISLREAGVLGASPKCAFFLRRSKSALLAKSLQQSFLVFCLPKRKAPAGCAGANFHLMKLQIILQSRSFLSPLFGSESQAALLSAAQSVFRSRSAVLPAGSWTGGV